MHESVTISIANPAGATAWTETVDVKIDNTYSTIIIAGGGGDWGGAGTFMISADGGDGEVATSEFVIAP